MQPDFSRQTVETLAKRAAYICSNPDCRVQTVGPSTDAVQATIIGEAAHIFGARPGSQRFSKGMTDSTRAEITNAIWLCRNCHRIIDQDSEKYTADLLFRWREMHEDYIVNRLGSKSDIALHETQKSKLQPFVEYPPIIERIVVDRPDGWEWRLTAELMRHLNAPHLRRLKDLSDHLYTSPGEHVDERDALVWISNQLHEMQNIVELFEPLLARLNAAWGAPGTPGNAEEIHHICCLVRDNLSVIVNHEERLQFAHLPPKFQRLVDLLKNLLSGYGNKFSEIPSMLDEAIDLINADHGGTKENPYVIHRIIKLEFPPELSNKIEKEIRSLKRKNRPQDFEIGCLSYIIIFIALLAILV